MAGALGLELNRQLTTLGVRGYLIAKESTFIPQWASAFDPMGNQFQAALGMYRPDLVIITLGGNELAMFNPAGRASAIKALVNSVGKRPCIWVAAPLWPKAINTGLLDVIKANCAPCTFVDTNAMIKLEVLKGDGIHPTIPERARWARFMIDWLRYNRDPAGPLPWSIKAETQPPPNVEPLPAKK